MSRAPAILLSPVVLPQAARMRREVPQLDPPAGPRTGGATDPEARRLVVIGDSTALGTGVASMDHTLAPRVALALADVGVDDGRGVAWSVHAENGLTAAQVREQLLDAAVAERPHAVVIVAGWNDAMHLRSPRAYAADLRAMVQAFAGSQDSCRIVLVAPPRFGDMPAFPQPLRRALGRHVDGLTRAGAGVARSEGVAFARGFDGVSVAEDGVHPDATGYARMADSIRRSMRRSK